MQKKIETKVLLELAKKYDPGALWGTCEWALHYYGEESQKRMVVEECGELLEALAREKRGRSTKEEILSELADVYIMILQMASLYGVDEFFGMVVFKENRLAVRLMDEDPKAKEIAKFLDKAMADIKKKDQNTNQ